MIVYSSECNANIIFKYLSDSPNSVNEGKSNSRHDEIIATNAPPPLEHDYSRHLLMNGRFVSRLTTMMMMMTITNNNSTRTAVNRPSVSEVLRETSSPLLRFFFFLIELCSFHPRVRIGTERDRPECHDLCIYLPPPLLFQRKRSTRSHTHTQTPKQ